MQKKTLQPSRIISVGKASEIIGCALLVISFSTLFGWIAGAVYGWGRPFWGQSQIDNSLPNEDNIINTVESSIEKNPKNEWLMILLAGQFLHKANRVIGSDKYFNEAIVMARMAWSVHCKNLGNNQTFAVPSTFKLRMNEADILFECNKKNEAKKIYEELMSFINDNLKIVSMINNDVFATFYNNYAYYLLTKKNVSADDINVAYNLIKQCLKSSPKASSNPAFLDTLALVLYKKGRKNDALQATEDALVRAEGTSLYQYIKRYEMLAH